MHHTITPLSAIGIVRYHRPDGEYLKLRNEFARNARISLRAFRVAGLILSHVDGFVQSQAQIAKGCGLSVNTVRQALEDLRRDGYLVSRVIREHGRVIGTAYAVSDVPFTDAERIALSEPCADSACAGSEHAESATPKKISSRRETTLRQKTNPSGGETAVAAPRSLEVSPIREQRQEDAVTPPAEALTLFDVPAPSKAQKAESPSAKTVTAAYIESYRRSHPGVEPSKRSVGRVASSAKALLSAAEADPGELTRAAEQMGQGPWDNLGMALKILRERGAKKPGVRGPLPALPHTHPVWQEIAREEDARTYQRILEDDELVRWVSGDPSEVDKWITRYPELAERFESVA